MIGLSEMFHVVDRAVAADFGIPLIPYYQATKAYGGLRGVAVRRHPLRQELRRALRLHRVRQPFHHFWPISHTFIATPYAPRDMPCLSANAYWMLIGACNLMVCPIRVLRFPVVTDVVVQAMLNKVCRNVAPNVGCRKG